MAYLQQFVFVDDTRVKVVRHRVRISVAKSNICY